MKAETKALIVLIVLVLSAGPITYFFNKGSDQIDLDGNGSTTPEYITGNAYVTWLIETIQPTISYIGVSNYNNENLVRQRLDSIKEIQNYTVDVKLSTQGSGYQYVISVPVEDDADRMVIGFKMMYWLSDFFDPAYSLTPLSIGTMTLPEKITLYTTSNQVEVNTKEDQKITAYFAYWQEQGNPVTVNCPEAIASELGNLIKVTQVCADTTKLYLYGLTELDFNTLKKEKTKTMQLTLKQFSETQFKGRVTGNISQETVKEALSSEVDPSEVIIQMSGVDYILGIPYKGDEKAYAIADKLRDLENITVEDQYHFALAEMPYTLSIDGKTYDMSVARNAYIVTPLNTELGQITADLKFYIIYDAVVGIEGEKA